MHGWDSLLAIKRPSTMGNITNDIVYARLAPGVLEELRCLNPTQPKGGSKHRHHQFLTPESGHPKLKEHLAVVQAMMRISDFWPMFYHRLERTFDQKGKTIPSDLDI